MTARTGVVEAGRLDTAIARLHPDLTRSRIAALIKAGRVTVDGRIVHRPGTAMAGGETVTIDVPLPVPAAAAAEDLPLRIVYEDDEVVVIDKAPGMVVHPSPGHASGTLVNALLHHVDDLSGVGGVERPGIVHRLDRGTSGLLVVAKTDRAHRALQVQFAAHTAGRTYLALCLGTPREGAGTIRSALGRHPSDRLRFASVARGGRDAITHWRVVARAGTVTLIECRLETGRTHQVRVHLAEQGWPILGDPTYGPRARAPAALRGLLADDRPLLHAWKLAFHHPDGRALSFLAPIPPDFARCLAAVGIASP